MSRLPIPTNDESPAATKRSLAAVQRPLRVDGIALTDVDFPLARRHAA